MASVAESISGQAKSPSQPIPWPALAWFTTLLIAAYFPILQLLVAQWSTDEDVGHGFFVPLVSLYIAWQRRERILALEYKPAWWGLAMMAWGGMQGYIGILGAE